MNEGYNAQRIQFLQSDAKMKNLAIMLENEIEILYKKTNQIKEKKIFCHYQIDKLFDKIQKELEAIKSGFKDDLDLYMNDTPISLQLYKRLKLLDKVKNMLISNQSHMNPQNNSSYTEINMLNQLYINSIEELETVNESDGEFMEHVEFLPAITQCLKSEYLGYLKFTQALPENISLIFKYEDQIIVMEETNTILMDFKCSVTNEIMNYLYVEFIGPTGTNWSVDLQYIKDNVFIFLNTKEEGMHQLSIKLYKVEAADSPYSIQSFSQSNLKKLLNIGDQMPIRSSTPMPKTTEYSDSHFTSNTNLGVSKDHNLENKNLFNTEMQNHLANEVASKLKINFNDKKSEGDSVQNEYKVSSNAINIASSDYASSVINQNVNMLDVCNYNIRKENLSKKDNELVKTKKNMPKEFEMNISNNISDGINNWFSTKWNDNTTLLESDIENANFISTNNFESMNGNSQSILNNNANKLASCYSNYANDNNNDAISKQKIDCNLFHSMHESLNENEEEKLQVVNQYKDEKYKNIDDFEASHYFSTNSRFESLLSKYIHLKIPEVPLTFMKSFGRDCRSENLCMPIGVVANDVGDVYVCDTKNNSVKIFGDDGGLKHIIREPRFKRPSAIILNESNEFFVKDDRQIYAFDSSANLKYNFGADKMERPYGLAFLNDGKILVFDEGSSRLPRILIFKNDGKQCENIYDYMPIKMKIFKSKCRFIETFNDKLFVVDLGLSHVYISDIYGKMIKSFGQQGNSLGNFMEPSGITKDSAGNIIIADSKNDRIQLFNQDGDFKAILKLNCPIKRPSDIFYHEKSHTLYVSNYLRQEVMAFKIVPL